jgi:secreted Zn-dependent insulinase-like peptidase
MTAVQVGSFHDPPDIAGLAHFLEHMVPAPS